MKDGLEANAEMSHFERIAMLDALRQHSNSFPVVIVEQRIVVRIQRRTLQSQTTCLPQTHTHTHTHARAHTHSQLGMVELCDYARA